MNHSTQQGIVAGKLPEQQGQSTSQAHPADFASHSSNNPAPDNGVRVDSPETYPRDAIPLLTEYIGRFRAIEDRIKKLVDRTSYDGLYYGDRDEWVSAERATVGEWLARMKPAAEELARDVSGMIDQGALSHLEKLQLRLHLADLESMLKSLPRLLNLNIT